MNFHVLTLFPDMVLSGLSQSIIGRAVEAGNIMLDVVNIRDHTQDKHKKVDDYPYGGGAGLLMQAQPVCDAHRAVLDKIGAEKKVRTVYLTPQGRTFTQRMAEELAGEEELILLCGHYEGIDERALEEVVTDYVSLGDFVLTGGELAAMAVIDAVARLVPGVLHNDNSAADESFAGYLLEYPQYTRPEEFRGRTVPGELLSGDHKKVRQWRIRMAEERTKERRPDMFAEYERLMACRNDLLRDKLHHTDMTELILRGNAKLLWHGEEGTLLQARTGGVLMLTVRSEESGRRILEEVFGRGGWDRNKAGMLVTHQEYMNPIAEKILGMHVLMECRQYVYTRKEELPRDKETEIHMLDESVLGQLAECYHTLDEKAIRDRLSCGAVYGAFVSGHLAGFVGEHVEGSMGMLHVLLPYRGRGIARALESDVINRTIRRGYTPFCQIEPDNEASICLQESLGLYPSKERIWWLSGK